MLDARLVRPMAHGNIFKVISKLVCLASLLKVTLELFDAHRILPSSRQSIGGATLSSILMLRTVRGEGGGV
jgi:hypothetical protein